MIQRYLYNLATDRKKGFFAGIFKIFLFILSLIYGLAVRVLSFVYQIKPYGLGCKVISVGNITLGGTGKTSLVELLARLLKDQGHKVAILSRGYKRKITNYAASGGTPPFGGGQSQTTNYQTMGDEPYMLNRNLGNIPVIVDKNRIRAARKAVQDFQVDTIILDDGLQQWRINKDLEIVAIDATNPLGNLHLLPRGILREPVSSLKRAKIFLLTKVNLNPNTQAIKERLSRLNPRALIVEAIYKPVGFYRLGESRDNLLNANEFQGRKIGLVCGIADPQSFESLMRDLGADIGLCFRFPDHHSYTEQDLDKIIRDSKAKGISIIITTEKDSVRFPTMNYELLTMNCFVLRIKLELLQYEIFIKRIHSLY